jgi:hypothetical protein
VSWNPTLSWTGGDPEGDPVNYTVVGHQEGTPFYLVWYGPHTDGWFLLSGLHGDTTYDWTVTADDGNGGITQGPEWTFTTAQESVYLPLILRGG